MKSQQIVIVGAGGHARELLDVLSACSQAEDRRWDVLGLIADDEPPQEVLERYGLPWLGRLTTAFDMVPSGTNFLVGVGSGNVRRRADMLASKRGLVAPVLIHPSATVGSHTALGPGSVVFSHASVTTNVRLGRHVHMNRGSTVGHDSVLADYVTLHPQSVVSGACHIGEASTLGTGSAVIELIEVGAGCIVGAGAAVVRNVPDGLTVVGVPARPLPIRRR